MGIALLAVGGLALAGCTSTEEPATDAPAVEEPGDAAPEASDGGTSEETQEQETEEAEPGDEAAQDEPEEGTDSPEDSEDTDAPEGSDDGGEASDDQDSAEGSDFFAPGAPVNAEDYAFERRGGVVYSFTVQGSDLQCSITDTDPLDEGDAVIVGCHGTFPEDLTVADPETDDESAPEVPANTIVMKGSGTEDPLLQRAGDPWLVPVTEDGSSFAEIKELQEGESINALGISCGNLGGGALACFSGELSFQLTAETYEVHENPRNG